MVLKIGCIQKNTGWQGDNKKIKIKNKKIKKRHKLDWLSPAWSFILQYTGTCILCSRYGIMTYIQTYMQTTNSKVITESILYFISQEISQEYVLKSSCLLIEHFIPRKTTITQQKSRERDKWSPEWQTAVYMCWSVRCQN